MLNGCYILDCLSPIRSKTTKACNDHAVYVCEICGRDLPLVRDHDHKIHSKITVLSFRGWLCSDCNLALGLFQDRPEILRIAALYLERERPKIRFVPPHRRHHR